MQACSDKASTRRSLRLVVLSQQDEEISFQMEENAEDQGFVMKRLMCAAACARQRGNTVAKKQEKD